MRSIAGPTTAALTTTSNGSTSQVESIESNVVGLESTVTTGN